MAMHKGKMKKKGMARGGMKMKKKGMARGGAKMPMAKDPKTGKMIPAFAMDGKGKMNKGGMMRINDDMKLNLQDVKLIKKKKRKASHSRK